MIEELETIATPLQQDIADALRAGLKAARQEGKRIPSLTEEQHLVVVTTMASMLTRRISGRYVAHVEDRDARDAAVVAAFNGRNRDDVIKRFGISRRLFYAILTRRRVVRNSAEI